jgi:hypothetical protein
MPATAISAARSHSAARTPAREPLGVDCAGGAGADFRTLRRDAIRQ